MKPLIVITGPTASGKSEFGIRLAKRFHGYVISADSRQVYRGMDIGTGKVTKKEMRGVPHELLDVVSPRTQYTVMRFQKDVQRILKKRTGIPFLVGGTGQYVSAVVENWDFPNVRPNRTKRKYWENQPFTHLVKRLRQLSPATAKRIDLNNPRRVIRALEVAEHVRQSPLSVRKKRPTPYQPLILGMQIPRPLLYERIDRRVDERMRRGMIAEVRRLHENGISWKRLDAFGLEYRFLARHLQGLLTKDEAVEQLQFAIHAFARRQMTWFRRMKDIRWVRTYRDAEKRAAEFLQKPLPKVR